MWVYHDASTDIVQLMRLIFSCSSSTSSPIFNGNQTDAETMSMNKIHEQNK